MPAALRTLAVVFAVSFPACSRNEGPTTHPLGEELITNDDGQVQFEFGYVRGSERALTLLIDMTARGTGELGKMVIDVDVGTFDVLEGPAQWSGFVSPMQHHVHRVELNADEEGSNTVTVTIRQAQSGTMLAQQSFDFIVTENDVEAVGVPSSEK